MSQAVDVLGVMLVVASGIGISRRWCNDRLLILPIGTLIGVGTQMAATTISVIAGLNRPAVAGFIAVVVLALVSVPQEFRRPTANTFVVLVVAGTVIRALASPYTYLRHVDSVNYMIISGLLSRSSDDLVAEVNPLQLKKRLFGTPTMHSLQSFTDTPMSILLGPWIGLMTLLTLTAIVWRLGGRGRRSGILAMAATLALASSSRFLMNVTYLNSHLVVGFAVLLVIGVGAVGAQAQDHHSLVVAVFTAGSAVMTLARPEGFLLVGVILLGFLMSKHVNSNLRSRLATWAGLAIALSPFSVLVAFAYRKEAAYDAELAYPVLLGLILVFAASAITRTTFLTTRLGILALAGGTIALTTVLIALKSDLASEMVSNWWGNYVLSGRWGWTILVAAPLAIISALLTFRDDRLRLLSTSVLLFPLIGLLTSVLRDSPGRVSDADSFNRMTMHIFPTLCLAIALGASTIGRQGRHHV